jgi:hypothetical protein
MLWKKMFKKWHKINEIINKQFFKQINLDKGHKYITCYNVFTFEIKDIKKLHVIFFFT